MPTAGPYGITQFDAAGVIGAYQQAQQNRIQMMLYQRQIAREDRKAETDSGVSAALKRYSGGDNEPSATDTAVSRYGGDTASPNADTGASGMTTTLKGQAPPAASTEAPVGPHRQPTAADREELFSTLMTLDPKMAGEVADAFGKMDQTQAHAAAQRNAVLGTAALHLLSIPQEGRAAELQRITPVLVHDGGITEDQIKGFEVNDNNLNFVLGQARDIEKVLKLNWDIEDDKADNTRADQGEASLDAYRKSQLANTRRGQDKTDQRGRRGQDIASKDRRYAIDHPPPPRGSKPPASKPVSAGDGAIIVNPKTGQRMKLQGGQWVAIP